jgi:hypothetical protein
MPRFNTFRINEKLVFSIRERKDDYIPNFEKLNRNIKIQSSVPRPVDFGEDVAKWVLSLKNV